MNSSVGSIPRSVVVRTAIVTVVMTVMTSACADLTKVTSSLTTSGDLNTPSGSITLRNGAVADFWPAYATQVVFSGYLSDELSDLSNLQATGDQRIMSPNAASLYPFAALSRVRLEALRAISHLQLYAPTPPERIGELYVLAGATEIFFAENLCSGIPVGSLVDDRVVPGSALSRSQTLRLALQHLDSAGRYTSSRDSIDNAVAVLRGRALLDSGDVSAAARAVNGVPSTAVYAPSSSLQAYNQVLGWFFSGASVADREGTNGLPFRSSADPRVPVANLGVINGYTDSTYEYAADTNPASTIPVASGIEAHLIGAEAALPTNGGAGSAWLDTLNALRNDGTYTVGSSGDTLYNAGEGGVAGLPPVSDPGTETAREDLVFRERAFWLFLTGHRQGDLRRLIRQYGRSVESVFPTGRYRNGGQYGTAAVFPVTTSEEFNNPTFHGCTDLLP